MLAINGEPPLPDYGPDVMVNSPYHFSWGSAAIAVGALMVLKFCWGIASFTRFDDEVFEKEQDFARSIRGSKGRHWAPAQIQREVVYAKRRRRLMFLGKFAIITGLLSLYLGSVLFAMELWSFT